MCLRIIILSWRRLTNDKNNLTPRQITEHLDRYIVGQNEAKRAVAIALRNRYRRSLLSDEMKAEVIPKIF